MRTGDPVRADRRPRAGRALGRGLAWAALAAVLALGFAGYLHPDMRLDWAALAQFCGLR